MSTVELSAPSVENITAMPENQNESPAELLRRVAVAVRISYTWFGVSRSLSASQKQQAAETFGADGRAMSAGKKILDVSHARFKPLTNVKGRLAKAFEMFTLPYVEKGTRLCRQSDVPTLVENLTDLRDEMYGLVREAEPFYPEMKEAARRRLGNLYCESDYPPSLIGLFNVCWDFPNVEPPSYLARLAPEVYQQQQQLVQARFEQAVVLAEQTFTAQFGVAVSHIAEALSPNPDGSRRRFHSSCIDNITEMIARFRRLNVGSSAQLEGLINDLSSMTRDLDVADLRRDASLRTSVQEQMAAMSEQLAGMVVDQPRRRIVRYDDPSQTQE